MGFGLVVMFAAQGFLTPSGIWLMTVGPTGFMLAIGLAVLAMAAIKVHEAKTAWAAQEGADRVYSESAEWADRLEEAGAAVVLGPGPKGEGNRFRLGATVVVLLFLGAFVPTMTVAVTTSIGPILAQIAVPTFLAVQEMAGGAEALRRYAAESDPSIASAPATSIFLGSQPRSAQVPPNGFSSTTATFQPAFATRMAQTMAAVPVPITTKSNSITIILYPQRSWSGYGFRRTSIRVIVHSNLVNGTGAKRRAAFRTDSDLNTAPTRSD